MVALNYGNFQTFSNPIAMGSMLFVDATNGSDTTGARGRLDKPFLTIGAAKAVAQSGDMIQVGPGLFAQGNHGHLSLPSGVSLNGSGIGVTTISSISTNNAGCLINPGANSVVSNLTIQPDQTTGGFPLGVDLTTADNASDNVILSNVCINGNLDGVYFKNNSGLFPAFTWRFFNCIINSHYDCTNIVPLDTDSPWPIVMELYNCVLNATYAGASDQAVRGLVNSGATGAIQRMFGGRIVCIGGAAVPVRAVNCNDGGIAELYGVAIAVSTAGSGVVNSIWGGQFQGSGIAPIIRIGPGCAYDPSLIGNDGNPVVITGTTSQILGTTGTTISPSTGAGTGATATLSAGSDDHRGQISIVTAGSPATAAAVCTVTFGSPKAGCFPTITPANAAAQALAVAAVVGIGSSSGTSFTIKSGATALATATTYLFNYSA